MVTLKDVAWEVGLTHEEFYQLPQFKKILYCRYVYGTLPEFMTISYIRALQI